MCIYICISKYIYIYISKRKKHCCCYHKTGRGVFRMNQLKVSIRAINCCVLENAAISDGKFVPVWTRRKRRRCRAALLRNWGIVSRDFNCFCVSVPQMIPELMLFNVMMSVYLKYSKQSSFSNILVYFSYSETSRSGPCSNYRYAEPPPPLPSLRNGQTYRNECNMNFAIFIF